MDRQKVRAAVDDAGLYAAGARGSRRKDLDQAAVEAQIATALALSAIAAILFEMMPTGNGED